MSVAPKDSKETSVSGHAFDIGIAEIRHVSLWARFCNIFSGRLDREQREARMAFIETGHCSNSDIELNSEQLTTARLKMFHDILSSRRTEDYKKQCDACKSMGKWILSLSKDNDAEELTQIKEALEKFINGLASRQDNYSSEGYQDQAREIRVDDLMQMAKGERTEFRNVVVKETDPMFRKPTIDYQISISDTVGLEESIIITVPSVNTMSTLKAIAWSNRVQAAREQRLQGP